MQRAALTAPTAPVTDTDVTAAVPSVKREPSTASTDRHTRRWFPKERGFVFEKRATGYSPDTGEQGHCNLCVLGESQLRARCAAEGEPRAQTAARPSRSEAAPAQEPPRPRLEGRAESRGGNTAGKRRSACPGPAVGPASPGAPRRRRPGQGAGTSSGLLTPYATPALPPPSLRAPSRGHSPYYSPQRKRRRHARPEGAGGVPVAAATGGPGTRGGSPGPIPRDVRPGLPALAPPRPAAG